MSWNSLSKKRKIFILSFVFVIAFVFATPLLASANIIAAGIAKVLLALLRAVAGIFAWVIKIEMSLFITLVQWNRFTHGITAVDEGWKITRDVCNMFFILMLLVIAFSTILNYEAYSYKKWLSKIIITAVLINFSKTIVGLMIDFSQVIMLTFVNAFKDIAMGNLINGLHLDSVFQVSYSEISDAKDEYKVALNLVVIAALAVAMLAILSAILAMFIVMIVWRIVYLWVLVILSPLAFFLQGTPFSGRASKWWTELGKQLTTGPVLAFFLYLALLTIQRAGESNIFEIEESKNLEVATSTLQLTGEQTSQEQGAADAKVAEGVGNMNNIFDFIIVIALLMTAMKITQESGVAGSNIAGKITSKMGNYVKRGARGIGRGVGRKVGGAARRTIVDPLNERVSKTWAGQFIPGTYANQLKKQRVETDRKNRVKERQDAVQKHAIDRFNDTDIGKVFYGKTGASTAQREKNERTFFGWTKMYGSAIFGKSRRGVIESKVTSVDKMTKTSSKIDKRIELNEKAKRALTLGVAGTSGEGAALATAQKTNDSAISNSKFEIRRLTKEKARAKTNADKQAVEAKIKTEEANLEKLENDGREIKEKLDLSKQMVGAGSTQAFIKDIIAAEKKSLAEDLNSILEGINNDKTISGSERKKKSQDTINAFSKRELELRDLDNKTTIKPSDLHDNKIYLSEQKEVFTREIDLQQQEVLQNNLINKEESTKLVSDAENRKAEAKYANLGNLDKDQVPAISQALASGNIAEVNVVMQKAAKDYNLEAILEKFGYEKSSQGLMEFLRRELVVDRQLLRGSNKKIEEQLALIANNISKEAGQYNMKYDKMAVAGLDGKMRSNVGFEQGADITSKNDMTIHWKNDTQKKIIDIIYSGKDTLDLFRKMHVSSYMVGNNPNPEMIQQLVRHERNLIDLINDGKTPFNPKILKVLLDDVFSKELKKKAPKLLETINKHGK